MISPSASVLIVLALVSLIGFAVSSWRAKRRRRRAANPTTRISRWH